MANRIGAGGPFIVAVPAPDFLPNNVGPSGNAGPKVIIRPRPWQGLYWYPEEDFIPVVVTPVDDEGWVNKSAGQYVYANQPKAEEELPSFAPALDEPYEWRSSYGPYSFAKPAATDEEVWIASVPVDDETTLPQASVQWKQGFAVLGDDEWVPQPVVNVVEEDAWLIGRCTPYGFSQAVLVDEEWINSIPIADDHWHAPVASPQYTNGTAFLADDEWVPQPTPFGLDEEYWLTARAAGQYEFRAPFSFEEELGFDAGTPTTGGGLMGGRKKRYSLRARKKEFKFLSEVLNDLAAEVEQVAAQSAAELSDEARAQVARNAEVTAKKYEQLRKLSVAYDESIDGIEAAIAFAKLQMRLMEDEEIMIIVALLTGAEE